MKDELTDARMLQKLLAVQEAMVVSKAFIFSGDLTLLKEVIAELRRRIELEETK